MMRVRNSAHLILRLDVIDSLECPLESIFAPEVFQRAISEMVQDLVGTEAIIDDIIVWGTTEAEHDKRLTALLD